MRNVTARWLTVFAILFVAIVPGALGLPLHANRALEMVGFEVQGIDSVDRRVSFVDVLVDAGECVGGSPQDAEERFDHAEVRVVPHAYVVSLFSRDDLGHGAEVCFGVGTQPFRRRVALPGPIGRLAVVSDGGPYRFRVIAVPPVGRRAARGLPPRFVYADESCAVVARHFKRVARARWCPND